MNRPIIGVVASRFLRNDHQTAGLAETYLKAITAAGGIPLLMHQTDDDDVLEWHYRQCNGLLLAGGGDVEAHHFGEDPHPNIGTLEPLRDAVELSLIRRAAADSLPTLGICRGAQVLNIALGGDIWQDVPSQYPSEVDHYASERLPVGEKHYGHPLLLTEGSWLAAQLGTTSLPVNTYHHQAIRQVAPGFVATAHAPDGIVEAIERTDGGLMVGIQCHPEQMQQPGEGNWPQVFAAFVAACAQRHPGR